MSCGNIRFVFTFITIDAYTSKITFFALLLWGVVSVYLLDHGFLCLIYFNVTHAITKLNKDLIDFLRAINNLRLYLNCINII